MKGKITMDKELRETYEKGGYKVTGDIIQKPDDDDPKDLDKNDNSKRI